jgi:hypothetical protein
MGSQYQSVNREAIWAALFSWFQSKLTAPEWEASTAYALNAIVTDPQGHLQQATTGGTSGATAPAWNDSGGTTTDGTAPTQITWQDTGAGFVSMGRKLKPPPDLGVAEQPAFFLVEGQEEHKPRPRGVPTQLLMHGFIIFYFQAPVVDEDIGQETVLAATQMNQMLLAIDSALEPDNPIAGVFTLGGTVSHCWIEGKTTKNPGTFGPQAFAMIPIHILAP